MTILFLLVAYFAWCIGFYAYGVRRSERNQPEFDSFDEINRYFADDMKWFTQRIRASYIIFLCIIILVEVT